MNVLIADDQTLFRDMMLTLFEKESDIQHAGSVSNGADAVSFCDSMSVDLVLMDIRMPHMDGVAAAKKLSQTSPQTKIILLSAFEDRDLSEAMQLPNVHAVLLKDIHADDLVQIIRLSHRGLFVANKAYLKPVRSAAISDDQAARPSADEDVKIPRLSALDRKILQGLSGGMNNREIAESVNYSEGTVKSHISRLLTETGLKDRTQLALFALKHHLI